MLGCLVAGAIVNFAMAWAVAYWWYSYGDEQSFHYIVSDDSYWLVNRDRGFGAARVWVSRTRT